MAGQARSVPQREAANYSEEKENIPSLQDSNVKAQRQLSPEFGQEPSSISNIENIQKINARVVDSSKKEPEHQTILQAYKSPDKQQERKDAIQPVIQVTA